MESNIGKTQRERINTVLFASLIIVYLLIWIGAMVRASGAGLGCPDWPTCFGKLIPPTDESQLPANYKEIYAVPGHEIIFNVRKTWTEYINRLFGVLTGIAITASLIVTLPLRKTPLRSVFFATLFAFVLVILEGWIGAKVVSSGLKPIIISLHMFLAIVIVYALIYAYLKIKYYDNAPAIPERYEEIRNILLYGTLILWISAFLQMFLGIQVRQQVDTLMNKFGFGTREQWANWLNYFFYIHRSFSWILFFTTGYLLWKLKEYKREIKPYYDFLIFTMVLIVLGMGGGYLLNYHAFPFWVQPFHLLIASLLTSIPFAMYFYLKQLKKI